MSILLSFFSFVEQRIVSQESGTMHIWSSLLDATATISSGAKINGSRFFVWTLLHQFVLGYTGTGSRSHWQCSLVMSSSVVLRIYSEWAHGSIIIIAADELNNGLPKYHSMETFENIKKFFWFGRVASSADKSTKPSSSGNIGPGHISSCTQIYWRSK